MKRLLILSAIVTFLVTVAAWIPAQSDLPLEQIVLPRGFTIEVYASGVHTARGLSFADNGVLFVGSRSGNVTAIKQNGEKITLAEGLRMPVGLDFHQGDLYVSGVSKIYVFENILQNLRPKLSPKLLSGAFPSDRAHGWKFIKVGPDEKLYVPVGAPCNICLKEDERYATIMRLDLDGRNLEVFARGVRNSVGFDWHPRTGELWFTDNGRDWLGDDLPPDELNRAPRAGLHFGFPFLHGSSVQDPSFWNKRPSITFSPPARELPAHVAALGMRFYQAERFPEEYRGGIFIAEHGSWNRSSKIGYRVAFVKLEGDRVVDYRLFAQGWLQGKRAWGRPADVEVGPDGALYVSDDAAHAIYRIDYRD